MRSVHSQHHIRREKVVERRTLPRVHDRLPLLVEDSHQQTVWRHAVGLLSVETSIEVKTLLRKSNTPKVGGTPYERGGWPPPTGGQRMDPILGLASLS